MALEQVQTVSKGSAAAVVRQEVTLTSTPTRGNLLTCVVGSDATSPSGNQHPRHDQTRQDGRRQRHRDHLYLRARAARPQRGSVRWRDFRSAQIRQAGVTIVRCSPTISQNSTMCADTNVVRTKGQVGGPAFPGREAEPPRR
jgi:hypothetical protein